MSALSMALISGKTTEELYNGILEGNFLSLEQVKLVEEGRQLKDVNETAIELAYASLKGTDADDDGELLDAMHDYAYENGLEFDGSNFWFPSTC